MKNVEKVFTKNLEKGIMNEKYNLLDEDEKINEREGLSMRKTNDAILKEITGEASFLKRIIFKVFKDDIIKVYKQGVKDGFNWNNKVR